MDDAPEFAVPESVGGAPVVLRLDIHDAGGTVHRRDLAAGDVLSLGRDRFLPTELLSDLDPDDPPGLLSARWPHLKQTAPGRIGRVPLGLGDGDEPDMRVSDHALVLFFAPAVGWTAFNCSGSGKTWRTQRWTRVPEAFPAGAAVLVPDRLAVWIDSDQSREHCIVATQQGAALHEGSRRLAGGLVPTLTDPPLLPEVLDDETVLVLAACYDQFLRWSPPLPHPAVGGSAADRHRLRTRIQTAVGNYDFDANGVGAHDNVHFLHWAVDAGLVTFPRAQRALAEIDSRAGRGDRRRGNSAGDVA